MLGSITPLGERGRGSRWWLTVAAYWWGRPPAGARRCAGGARRDARRGLVVDPAGSRSSRARSWSASRSTSASAGCGCRPPIARSTRSGAAGYRGWVWGLAFGFQLAVGVVTVVTTSTVYVTWLAAGLSGSPVGGAAIGARSVSRAALPIFAWRACGRQDSCCGVDTTLRGSPLPRAERPTRRRIDRGGRGVGAVR